MTFAKKVTIFVTFYLIFLSIVSHGEEVNPQLIDFSLHMGSTETVNPDSKPYANMLSTLEYNFTNIYSFGVSYSYLRTVDQINNNGAIGFGDLSFFLADKELWKNRYTDTTLSTKLGYIAPVSYLSQLASERWGFFQTLSLKQGFGDSLSLTYTGTASEYGYIYTTVAPSATGGETVYNTLDKFSSRLALNYDIDHDLHWMGGVWMQTYYNTIDQYTNLYGMVTSISYDVAKSATIDFGISSAFKESGTPDVWDSPTYSDSPFGLDGITIFFGTTIRI